MCLLKWLMSIKVKAQMFMQVWYFSLHYYLITRFFNCIVKQKLLPVLLYCCYSFQCSFQIHTEAHNVSAFYFYHLCNVSFIILGNIIVFFYLEFCNDFHLFSLLQLSLLHIAVYVFSLLLEIWLEDCWKCTRDKNKKTCGFTGVACIFFCLFLF